MQLAGRIQPAAHRGQGRMRAQNRRVFRVEEITQRRGRGQLGIGLVHDQRLGAPVRRHVVKRAILARAFARRTVGQTGQVVVDRELGFVPRREQAVRVPAAPAVDGRLKHVDAARFQRDLAFGEHGVLVGQFLEVDGDPGCGGEGREDLFSKCRITCPADEVHFARRGERLRRDDRRCGEEARTRGGPLQEPAAVEGGCGFFHV
jgi:hypothetical protein